MHVEKEDMKLVGGRREKRMRGDGETQCAAGAPEDPNVDEEVRNMSRRMKQDTVVFCCTLTVLSTAPEKRRPLETARAVTLP